MEPREFSFEIPEIRLPAKNDDAPRNASFDFNMILSPAKNDDSPRDVRRSLSADDWAELGQSDLKQIGVSFSKQLTAEISHCSQQLWELHDTLTAVIGECIGVMVELMHREHDRNLRDFYSRFILLNRLSLLDLSGEVKTRSME